MRKPATWGRDLIFAALTCLGCAGQAAAPAAPRAAQPSRPETAQPAENAPPSREELRKALVGTEAPEISGAIAFQGDVTSLRDLRGKVVLVEFWASYCDGCRALAPTLDDWHRSLGPRGLTLVGVTVDLPVEGARVAQKLGMTYPLLSDPDALIVSAYHAEEIPMLVLLDRAGVVVDVLVGPSEAALATFRSSIEALLGAQ
jgi:cytochrome c biogenesis protein CcmG, thiol:disulfide interchange protein DsbE